MASILQKVRLRTIGLPRKCGQAVGISVDNCEGGRDSLVAFDQQREAQNSDQTNNKSQQKGRRELEGLRSTINYDQGRTESGRRLHRGSKKS